MSWYYPEGVTGYEPEIAGYDEVELIVDCDNEKMEVVSHVDLLVYAVPDAVTVENIDYVPCEYSGYVTGYIVGEGVEWDCPRCGETHTEYP